MSLYTIKEQEKNATIQCITHISHSHDFCFSYLLFLSLFSPPSVLLSLLFPPSPLLLLCLHLLLPPSEQTAAKSLNIPNIQRNPGLSLSLSQSASMSLVRTYAQESTCLSPSLSLSQCYTQESACLSLFLPPWLRGE